MNRKDHSFISRNEKGEGEPSIEMILSYQLIFDISFEKLFEGYRNLLRENIQEQIPRLIHTLKTEEPNVRIKNRITYLSTTLQRLEQFTLPNPILYDFHPFN